MGAGGNVGRMLERFSAAGYSIEIVGHSLGGGVATLLALLLHAENSNIKIDVYAYAVPACVSPRLENRCHRRPTDKGGVKVISTILQDDAVPRASARNILALAKEIVERKKEWQPALAREIKDIQRRALGLWAPMTRSTHWMRMEKEGPGGALEALPANVHGGGEGTGKPLEEPLSPLDIKAAGVLLLPPGPIIHIFSKNGQRRASLVQPTWAGFGRVEVSRHMFTDHSREYITAAMRDVLAARSAPNKPPIWPDAPHIGPVLCAVCGYSVAWASSSDNPLEQSRFISTLI
ncbi:hypothetical protein AAMO2058_000676600 [Amorphochlora amoebiformis]